MLEDAGADDQIENAILEWEFAAEIADDIDVRPRNDVQRSDTGC